MVGLLDQGPRLLFFVLLIAGWELCEGLAVAVGWGGELGVADGGAVASHVDGVHDGESAAYSECEAEKEADERRPVEGHYDCSLSCSIRGRVLCGYGFGVRWWG